MTDLVTGLGYHYIEVMQYFALIISKYDKLSQVER